MKKAYLLHNPTAGDKDFTGPELTRLIKKEGFDCSHASVKEEGWDEFDPEVDFLVCAGGDGTIRRIAKALMKRKRIDKQYPVAVLPHGTANNIATTLGIDGQVKDIVRSWKHPDLQKFDLGKLYGLEKEDQFFLEGFGLGIFPRLMKEMDKLKEDPEASREDKIRMARIVLHQIVTDFEPVQCEIVADGVEYSGKYIMVEVLNTRSIGPNLELSSSADPGDGELDLVLIPSTHQKKFAEFLLNRINNQDEEFTFTVIKAQKIEIVWKGKDCHIDDERIKVNEKVDVQIEIQPGMMEFLV